MIGASGFMQAPIERPAYGTAMIRCGKTKCKWRGKETDLVRIPHREISSMHQSVCPSCGCDSYMFMTEREIAAYVRATPAPTGENGN